MSRIVFLFFMNYFLLSKISHAQFINRNRPNTPPTHLAKTPIPAPTAPTSTPTAPTPTPAAPTSTPSAPSLKCYPETATVYFLPAPPSAPKITILDQKSKEAVPNLIQNVQEKPLNLFKEVPATSPSSSSNEVSVSNHTAALPPPPPCSTGLPDLIDDMPSKVQERLSRLVKSVAQPPACESCAALIKKLPIFNFDQELLNGFLAGIGI